ncbi:hypothetical protein MNBD_GAMMA07-1706 [hydrothermal vent metagenome]|uniref:Type IV fimbrial biogenesis protein PilW n=1 Tax=hydrothermal vent metagenome TaxID=652676 RepID=A0A3B0WXX1_9ZZZZ
MIKHNIQTLNRVKNHSGFTLIEILIALLLGIGILVAALTMQIQHRKGFQLSSSQLQMQTNAKFAFEFISKSLRSAGSLGCKTGLELRGELNTGASRVTADATFYGKAAIAFNNPNVAYANFKPGFEVLGYEYAGGLIPIPPLDFKFVSLAQYNANSDVLTVAGGYGEVYPVFDAILPIDSSFQLRMTGLSQVRVAQSQYGLLSGCSGAKIFKITSSNASIELGQIGWAGGGGDDDNKTGQGNALGLLESGGAREFRRAAVVTYFVGMSPLNATNGVPTLYMDVDGVSNALIEGVEEIQIQYGLSESPTRRNIADRYLTADVIDGLTNVGNNEWEKVVSVRVGIIMRSSQQVFQKPPNPVPSVSLACVGYTQTPARSDNFSRTTYCAEISLRNRLVGTRVGSKI